MQKQFSLVTKDLRRQTGVGELQVHRHIKQSAPDVDMLGQALGIQVEEAPTTSACKKVHSGSSFFFNIEHIVSAQ
jgi:hypothetical protein